MRSWFSMIGLMVVVAAVGLIASRQLSSLRAVPAAVSPVPGMAAPAAGSPVQLPAQYKQALDAAMQTARPIESDAK